MEGRRHNFKSGGTNVTASEARRKFFGVVLPTYAILGVQPYNSYKEAYWTALLQSYWSCSYIYWPIINIRTGKKLLRVFIFTYLHILGVSIRTKAG